ncbi:MAG: acetyl-CoA C-acetyltransferase [Actinomycetota bacterium]|nr:acetyl-CoA C-acetyltransferase [Actinomycetota bacterium]
MAGTVLVSSARTPIGKIGGAFASLSAADLGATAIKAALERAGLDPEQVDYVVMGQVLQAGQGQNPARQAAIRAGIPMTIPSVTLNKVCLSSLNAIHLADLMIRSGEAEIVVAGGMESMSGAPYLLPDARSGYKMGNGTLYDAMIHDGLWDAYDDVHMGGSTEKFAGEANISREEQDELAARSHERAAAAAKEGRLADEIVPVSVPQKKGEPVLVEDDEGIRPGTTPESLAKLKAAFSKEGTITAGNASQISDGAAAVVMMSAAKADELGIDPKAEVLGYGMVAGPDPSLLTQPSRAIKQALERANVSLEDVALFEINEAFAAVVLASMADLGIDAEQVNVNGGAIALGHPIGMSGARLALTLVEELQRRGGGLGAAGLCGGGGQGDAVLVRVG